MREILILRGQTNNIGFAFIQDSSSTTGAGLTGVTSASASLNISVRREKSSAMTTYTGANIGAILTLGTWANPGTGKVNIKAVDATNAPGLYELHFEDAIFNSGDTSRKLIGHIFGVTNMAQTPFEVPLVAVDAQDATAFGVSRIDAAISSRMATYTQPTGFLGATFPGSVSSLTQTQVSGWAGPILTDNTTGAVTVGSLTTAAIALIWNVLISTMSTAGSIGKLIKDFIGASTYAAPPTAAAIATQVELQIMDDTDGRTVLQAIVDKINAADANLSGLTLSAISAAVWRDTTSGDFTVANSAGAKLFLIGTNGMDSPNSQTANSAIATIQSTMLTASAFTSAYTPPDNTDILALATMLEVDPSNAGKKRLTAAATANIAGGGGGGGGGSPEWTLTGTSTSVDG